jgi:predicted RNA-binding Zn-ribbon protein involved in translation (DUF1610 family)
MSVEEAISKAADQIAHTARTKLLHLEEQCHEAEDHLAHLKSERIKASAAPYRRASFQAKIGNDYQCPQCWIIEENRRSVLSPRSSETSDDIFVCRHCGYQIISPG